MKDIPLHVTIKRGKKVIMDKDLDGCILISDDGYMNTFTLPYACFKITNMILQDVQNDIMEIADAETEEEFVKLPAVKQIWKSTVKGLMKIMTDQMIQVIDDYCDDEKETVEQTVVVDLNGLLEQLKEQLDNNK